jgi:hypothetical protein
MRLIATFGLCFAVGLVGTVSAAPINIDSPAGDPTTPGFSAPTFTWQGLKFELDGQPGGAVNAPHRVQGDSTDEVSIFLEEPGKVSYRAELPDFGSSALNYALGFRYGDDLTASTPSFSNMTGFYRTIDGGTEIVQQLLAGSDDGNANSVFYGSTGRTAAGGSMQNQAFLNNLGFGVDGLFEMTVLADGTATSSVTAGGTTGADFSVDLTPSGTPSPFVFDELLLQVESFQDMTSFTSQFGDAGQEFVFTSARIQQVPTPGSMILVVAGLAGLLGVTRLQRRRL